MPSKRRGGGVYPESIVIDVEPERLKNFFNKGENVYEVKKSLRDMMVFAVQNAIADPPFSKIDLISCRNLLIYMGPELQRRILPLFHYSLNPGGYLFLGTSETLGESSEFFEPVDKKWKIFQRNEVVSRYRPVTNMPLSHHLPEDFDDEHQRLETQPTKRVSFREVAERLLLDKYSPACAVINEKCEILYIHGHTGKYLEPAVGDATLNIMRMARDGLRLELTTAIRKVMMKKEEIRYKGLKVTSDNETNIFNLIVQPINNPAAFKGLIAVIFEDVERWETDLSKVPVESTDQCSLRVAELEHELSSTKEYLQTSVEELESSNEELKLTNEELQSSNEELQSTNEELETSKEELQSVNEELVTVNTELETKIDQLSKANNDLHNLFATTEIGTVFLDLHLCIQRYTPAVSKIINLIESDIGRPISHIVTNIYYGDLEKDAKKVLETLVPIRKEVQSKEDGSWYAMRITPYRTTENVIEGVVITFSDITELKERQLELRKIKQALDQSASMAVITDPKGKIEYVNQKFYEVTGYNREETIGKIPHFMEGDDSNKEYLQMWKTIKAGKEWRGELQNRKKNDETYWEMIAISPIKDEKGKISNYVAVKEDITKRKQSSDSLKASEEKIRSILNTTIDGIISINEDREIEVFNHGAEKIFGYTVDEVVGKNVKMLMPEPYHSEHDAYVMNYLKTGKKKIIGIGREVKGKRKDGSIVPLYLYVGEAKIGDKRIFTGILRDLTTKKQVEKALRKTTDVFDALDEWSRALLEASDEKFLMESMCRIITSVAGYRMAWVGLITSGQEKSVKPLAFSGYEGGSREEIKEWSELTKPEQDNVKKAIKSGRPEILSKSDRKTSEYGSGLALPLVEDEKVIGVLTVYAADTDAFGDREIQLLQKLSKNLSQGIRKFRDKESN